VDAYDAEHPNAAEEMAERHRQQAQAAIRASIPGIAFFSATKDAIARLQRWLKPKP
jgi:hypothetical protein